MTSDVPSRTWVLDQCLSQVLLNCNHNSKPGGHHDFHYFCNSSIKHDPWPRRQYLPAECLRRQRLQPRCLGQTLALLCDLRQGFGTLPKRPWVLVPSPKDRLFWACPPAQKRQRRGLEAAWPQHHCHGAMVLTRRGTPRASRSRSRLRASTSCSSGCPG